MDMSLYVQFNYIDGYHPRFSVRGLNAILEQCRLVVVKVAIS